MQPPDEGAMMESRTMLVSTFLAHLSSYTAWGAQAI